MTDIVSPEVRSRMMSAIRSKNTKPEIKVRKALYALGYRYRLHSKQLPGKPDIILSKYRAAIFINGCFWHGHDCSLFRWPATRKDFWNKKINANRDRDKQVRSLIKERSWRQLIIWECAFRGKHSIGMEDALEKVNSWLLSDREFLEVRGHSDS